MPEDRVKARERKRRYQAKYRADGRHVAANRAYRERHPERRRARSIVAQEVRMGRLVPQPCARAAVGDCSGPVEAHHDDYSRPLDVRWLCRRHHHLLHLELSAAAA